MAIIIAKTKEYLKTEKGAGLIDMAVEALLRKRSPVETDLGTWCRRELRMTGMTSYAEPRAASRLTVHNTD